VSESLHPIVNTAPEACFAQTVETEVWGEPTAIVRNALTLPWIGPLTRPTAKQLAVALYQRVALKARERGTKLVETRLPHAQHGGSVGMSEASEQQSMVAEVAVQLRPYLNTTTVFLLQRRNPAQ
jgi:hypothetical protein